MFTFSSKRQWAPDGSVDSEDVATREKKRPRHLTLRTPETCQTTSRAEVNQLLPQFQLSTLTPVEFSDNDSDDQRHINNATHATTSLQEPPPSGSLSDSAMDVDSNRDLPPSINGDDLSPWPTSAHSSHGSMQSPIPHALINQSLSINGHPVATNQAASPANPDSTVAMDHDLVLRADVSNLNPDAARNHETVWWTLPGLPSPISEDEGVCVNGHNNLASNAGMPYTSPHPASSHSYGVHQDQMLWNNPPNMQVPSINNSSTREGTESSTAAAVSKKKKVNFFMGYRADCDKCRQKVPGHYSHIIHA